MSDGPWALHRTRHRNPRRAGGFPEHTGKRLQT
jgi:hypothetical protein